jgi:hypothetical protein
MSARVTSAPGNSRTRPRATASEVGSLPWRASTAIGTPSALRATIAPRIPAARRWAGRSAFRTRS